MQIYLHDCILFTIFIATMIYFLEMLKLVNANLLFN